MGVRRSQLVPNVIICDRGHRRLREGNAVGARDGSAVGSEVGALLDDGDVLGAGVGYVVGRRVGPARNYTQNQALRSRI